MTSPRLALTSSRVCFYAVRTPLSGIPLDSPTYDGQVEVLTFKCMLSPVQAMAFLMQSSISRAVRGDVASTLAIVL
jgi:hypothetical protein